MRTLHYILLLLTFFTGGISPLWSQNDVINQQKYWHLRAQFVERFVKIGPNQGESLPAGAIVPKKCMDNVANDGTDPAIWQYTDYGEMHWGDGTIRQGHYLALLATEYALKKKNQLDVTGTLNELYYAIHAVNRLDRAAEPALNHAYGTSYTEMLNGFYLREDVPEDFTDNWEGDKMNYGCVNSAYYENINVAKLNDPSKGEYVKQLTSYQNVPSMDQMSSLLVGFSLVHKLVDNVFVQPSPSDAGFYIINETQAIVDRLVSYASKRNWELIDVNGWPVANGGGDLAFAAYAYVQAASRITGKPMDAYSPYFYRKWFRYHPKYNAVQHCITGFGVSGERDKQAAACKKLKPKIFFPFINGMKKKLTPGTTPGDYNNQYRSAFLSWDNSGVSRKIGLSKILWKNPLLNMAARIGFAFRDETAERLIGTSANRNQTISFNVGVVAGNWNAYVAHTMGNVSGNRQLELANAVLYDREPAMPKWFYQGYLNSLKDATPYNLRGTNWVPDPEGPWYTEQMGAANGWATESRWSQTQEVFENGGIEGVFNGLDYMIFHNLYYLIYEDELPAYQPDYPCNCSDPLKKIPADSLDEEQREAYDNLNSKLKYVPNSPENIFDGTLNFVRGDFAVAPTFTEYERWRIPTVKYQTHDATISNRGKVNVISDLIICGGKTLSVEAGGELVTEKGSIIVKKGSELRVKGTLHVTAHTKLVLEEGARIRLLTGAKLLLDDTAKIHLQPHAEILLHTGTNLVTDATKTQRIYGKHEQLENGVTKISIQKSTIIE